VQSSSTVQFEVRQNTGSAAPAAIGLSSNQSFYHGVIKAGFGATSNFGRLTFATAFTASPVDRMVLDEFGSLALGISLANASSILDLTSTTKGFLPPRMTTTQKNAIATPAAGLVVYDTTLGKLCVRTASSWETITSI
jgi:hypothetical protein